MLVDSKGKDVSYYLDHLVITKDGILKHKYAKEALKLHKKALAEIKHLKTIIRKLEWASDDETSFCPECAYTIETGHASDCDLYEAIKEEE